MNKNKGSFMSRSRFHSTSLTGASVSLLALTLLGGCTGMQGGKMAASQQAPASVTKAAPYDAYYGSPATNAYDAQYSPRIERRVIKPVFKTTAPKRYVVKKGDTLWGISNMFLNNPGYWPEIWDENQKLANPHRIYPGDVLSIYEGGRRKIRLEDGRVEERLVPQMRIERNGTGEPISTLAPFLVWPRVLDEDVIQASPYIVHARDAHLLFEKGDRVYIKNLGSRHNAGRYAIYRQGKPLHDGEQLLGHEVVYNGYLNVERRDAIATGDIIDSSREIRPGDRLLNIQNEEQFLNATIQKPRHKVRAEIISLFDANMVSGQSMVVTINKGVSNGIKPGYTLGIYSPGKTVKDPYEKQIRKYAFSPEAAATVDLPPERAATAIVYKVENNLSYALVTESSHEVKNGYKIGNP